jgi:multidrug efflux pump subunit AcrA (membrane-fusion protein)
MVPRTERNRGKAYETYQCLRRKTMGSAACTTPIITRAQVEVPMLRMFERDALSFEATRAHVADQLNHRIDEARAQAARAEREATELATQADRIERDYRRGALPAEDYARLRNEIASERTATAAEAKRLIAHAEAMTATHGNLDAEDETLRRLTDLRAAIAGRMTDAGSDVGALRTAIAQVFRAFWVVHDPFNPGQFGILPEVRPGLSDLTRAPAYENHLQRVRIPFAVEAENYEHGTELWKYMTQNTLRLS